MEAREAGLVRFWLGASSGLALLLRKQGNPETNRAGDAAAAAAAATVPFPRNLWTVSYAPFPLSVPKHSSPYPQWRLVFLSLWRKTSRGSECNVAASNSWQGLGDRHPFRACISLDYYFPSFTKTTVPSKRPFSLGSKALMFTLKLDRA